MDANCPRLERLNTGLLHLYLKFLCTDEPFFRIEYFSPPYMNMHRPSFSDMPGRIDYGVDFQVQIELQDDHDDEIQVVLMDYGYSTHGCVSLELCRKGQKTEIGHRYQCQPVF